MNNIDLHADDYGISPYNSTRILELVKSGHLDSFSIIPNMRGYDECMNILKAQWNALPSKPAISVHINLIGGRALSPNFVPFNSWGEIFLKTFSLGNNRTKFKQPLKEEIKCQISRIFADTNALDITSLRLDSHIHVHMIPIVFDAMMDAVNELELLPQLEYVRVSKEPLWMFFTTKGIAGTFPIANVIKNLILRLLSIRANKKLKKLNIHSQTLWGLIMSGNMNESRVKTLLPKMNRYALNHHTSIELLAHPGRVLEGEISDEFGPDDKTAFVSQNRDVEYNMFAFLN